MGFPFHYELGETALEVRLGSWILRRVGYRDIAEVRPGWALWNEHWTNVWPLPPRYLNLRLRRNALPNFLITPENREEFAAALRKKIAGAPPP